MLDDSRPPEYAELVADISRLHTVGGGDALQSDVLGRCIAYILRYADLLHLFCNPYMQPVSTHFLISFSFDPPGASVLQIRPLIVHSLETCERCIDGFYHGMAQIRARFAIDRKVPVRNVDLFMDLIHNWQATRLDATLGEIRAAKDDPATSATALSPRFRCAIYECLTGANLLRRGRPSVKTQLLDILLHPDQYLVSFDRMLLPGDIFFFFEGSASEKTWVQASWRLLRDQNVVFTAETLPQIVVDEFSVHLYRIQDPKYFTPDFCINFWSCFLELAPLLDKLALLKLNTPRDITVMSEYTKIGLLPLIRVYMNNVMAYLNEPLPQLLKLLVFFLDKFGFELWSHCAPYGFTNILDTVLLNPFYPRKLQESSEDEIVPLLTWTELLVSSLSGGQRLTAAVRIATFLLNVFRNLKGPSAVVSTICSMLLKCFEFSYDDFADKAFSAKLLKSRDARASVESLAELIVGMAIAKEDIGPGPALACELIAKCVAYDISSLAHNSSLLKQATPVIPTTFDAFPLLWHELQKRTIYSSQRVVSEILTALQHTSSIVKINLKKNEKSSPASLAISQHNSNVTIITGALAEILEKLGMADPRLLKLVLAQKKGSISFWSCILWPYTSQASLDVLYQAFNDDVSAGGRLEAMQGLLNYNLSTSLEGLIHNLRVLTELQVFEPSPRALRIFMDVFSALCDPLNGILITDLSGQAADEIQTLWKETWLFLVMIYERTLVWAGQYHLEELVEFTRDTLDLSHLLLNSFRVIVSALDDVGSASTNTLFQVFMDAFHHVIIWLRLGDVSLLNSCVDLVFKGFDLAKDLNFSVDATFITTFAKFGAKAKKFNNKLTEKQRSEILAKASEFDEGLVEQVLREVRKQRGLVKSPLETPPSDTAYIENRQPEAATYRYQTHPKGAKQQTLGRFGVVTNVAPVAPPPIQTNFKLSNLEAIRKDLKSSRAVKPVAAINPAPPRPAGFNKVSGAPPVIGRSLNKLKKRKTDSDSSDDDDEEDEVDLSDLFVEKKSRPKVVEVDIHGRPVIKSAQKKKMTQERIDEENMRLRLNVNLKPLYTNILKWNYNSSSNYPSAERDIYRPTSDTYSDIKDYVRTTEPLLMLECWQGIQSAKNTGQEAPFELLVGSRASCDGFFDVYASIKKKDLSERKIGDSDLVVLGHAGNHQFSSEHEMASYLKSEEGQTCLAKVREIKSANADYSDITLRVFPQGPMMGLLTPKSVIIGMKVMQMITIEREFTSLKGLQYYDLASSIISAKPNEPVDISDSNAQKMLAMYDLNKSQAKAIMGSYNSEGFSLIQGPPGTGKTKTILGIVGYSLSQQRTPNAIIAGESASSSKSPSPEEFCKNKILVCAPSNAAVDELVLRLRNGVRNTKGETVIPKVVRMGRSDAINAAVRDLTLEELVDKQLKSKASEVSIDPNIRTEHTKCIQERDRVRKKLSEGGLSEKDTSALEAELREINKKRNDLGKRLDDQRENASIAYRTREIEKRQLQAKILNSAQIICSTLSGSAHDFLASLSVKFEQVIIDEACQSVELSAIIPLRYGCKKCIMVGDPNQLPPTVLSQAAASFNYEQSLFVRMQKNYPESVYLLDVQYRMHPDISKFPSSEFYHSRLKDGPGMAEKNARAWHSGLLTPYRFFDIVGRHLQNQLSRSLFNMQEAKVALELVEHLMVILPDNKFKGRIGIISPYKEQIRTLKDVFRKKYGHAILDEIDFNTVDGFQGQEKEIIIMSCVRASDTGNVGFLSDVRRMNVALTRAKTSLWILGNMNSLKRNKVWNRLLSDAESRDAVSEAYPGFMKKPMPTTYKRRTNDDTATHYKKQKIDESNPAPETGSNGAGPAKEHVQKEAPPQQKSPVSTNKEAPQQKRIVPPPSHTPQDTSSANAHPKGPSKTGPVHPPKHPKKHKNVYVHSSKPNNRFPTGPSSNGASNPVQSTSEAAPQRITPTSSGQIQRPQPKKTPSIFINQRKKVPPRPPH